MAVKLDVKLNWLVDKYSLESKISDAVKSASTKRAGTTNIGKGLFKDYFFGDLDTRLKKDMSAITKLGDVFEKTLTRLRAKNRKGELVGYLGTKFPFVGRQKNRLNDFQLFQLAEEQAWAELFKDKTKEAWLKTATETTSKKYTKDQRAKQKQLAQALSSEAGIFKEIAGANKDIDKLHEFVENEKEKNFQARLNSFLGSSKESFLKELSEKMKLQKEQEEFLKYQYESEEEKSKADYEHHKEQEKKLKEDKKKDEQFRRNALNAFFMRWGKLGIAGLVAGQVIRVASKIAHLIYNTSMQGLDWRRTISGGASGGSWFGQDIAAYQRAGLGANQIQGFKRGLQSYLGSVKLGMGNAAPLMMLGLNALDNPDAMEKQIERSLRRFPKDVSLALAQQMGLDYGMWEAIYNGRLDRSKSAYSEEAMQKWAEVADKLNDLLTSLKVFGFDKFANITYGMFHPIDTFANASLIDKLLMLNPATFATGFAHAAQNVTINVNANTQDGYQQGQEIGRGCRDAFMQYRES